METKTLDTDTKANGPTVLAVDKDGIGADLCKCCEDHETIKMSMLFGSKYEIRNNVPKWFAGLGLKELISHTQSESDGNVTITIIYR